MDFNSDNIYEGDWVNGVFEGYGTFKWANGKVYKGISLIIQGSTKMVLSMELESLFIRTLVDTMENGKMANKTVKESCSRIIF